LKKLLPFNYETSKDYEKLFELIQSQRVVCFVDYKINDNTIIKDVCISSPINELDKYNSINIGARGISYITAFDFKEDISVKEDFINQCKNTNLEFIIPD